MFLHRRHWEIRDSTVDYIHRWFIWWVFSCLINLTIRKCHKDSWFLFGKSCVTKTPAMMRFILCTTTSASHPQHAALCFMFFLINSQEHSGQRCFLFACWCFLFCLMVPARPLTHTSQKVNRRQEGHEGDEQWGPTFISFLHTEHLSGCIRIISSFFLGFLCLPRQEYDIIYVLKIRLRWCCASFCANS